MTIWGGVNGQKKEKSSHADRVNDAEPVGKSKRRWPLAPPLAGKAGKPEKSQGKTGHQAGEWGWFDVR